MTDSSSGVLRTGAALGSTPRCGAAALKGPKKYDPPSGAVSGLNKNPTLVRRGTISFSSPNHFPPSDPSILTKPVTLPPGRARLGTKRLPIGSETPVNTIGID